MVLKEYLVIIMNHISLTLLAFWMLILYSTIEGPKKTLLLRRFRLVDYMYVYSKVVTKADLLLNKALSTTSMADYRYALFILILLSKCEVPLLVQKFNIIKYSHI